MAYFFGTQTDNQQTISTPPIPIEIHEISMKRLLTRNLIDGYYKVNNKHGTYIGQLVKNRMHGSGKYTMNNGDYSDGIWKEGDFVTGTRKIGDFIYTGELSKNDDGDFVSLNGTIDYGNGISFTGLIENNKPIKNKGNFKVAPKTPIEFTEWRDVKSGNLGTLTHIDNWWIQTYSTGSVKEIKSKDFSVILKRVAGFCPIFITFRDGCTYTGYSLTSEYDNVSNDDKFTETPQIDFNNWDNYQLDYWLVSNRGFDHFPDDFFVKIRNYNVTGQQLLNFDDTSLKHLGLYKTVFRNQLVTSLKRFQK